VGHTETRFPRVTLPVTMAAGWMNAVGSITVEANDSDPARARNFLTTKMRQICSEITVDFREASLFPRESAAGFDRRVGYARRAIKIQHR
jgi:hypothetical protein